MNATRFLIVNADDFGQSAGVNRGVIDAHEHGIVTSASLMVRWPAAVEAARYARSRGSLSLGLHLDLGEWVYCDGHWVARYQVVALDDPQLVTWEIERQIERFVELARRAPTHLDSHQHVHLIPPVREAALAAAARLGVPLRQCRGGIRHCGEFYGQNAEGAACLRQVDVDSLVRVLRGLAPGITELACHPGLGADLDSTYNEQRSREVRTLCDPSLPGVLAGESIALRSFASAVVTGIDRAENIE